jgi:hyperosmotically inducible protein
MRNSYNSYKLITLSALVLSLGVATAALAETTGQYIDDATITTKVKAALLADDQLKSTKVSVETNQGTVKLTGLVASKTQESEAIKVANQVSGVKSVKDLLTVRASQED